MDIIELEGEDRRLCYLVGNLVMKSEVLKYNLDYPYRTSAEYRWFVATKEDSTLGFIPVKIKDGKASINNYYVADDDNEVFSALLTKTKESLLADFDLESVVQIRHTRFFEYSGFSVVHYWKKYVKMRIYRNEEERI